ncbi:glycosyltransferase family 2 protein [Kaistella daneshvariae]|nr:glycosyltransferase family 2 protein [Kaistella daneshvariae]
MRVLVVIVTYNAMRHDWIKKCLQSIEQSSIIPDVFIIDNNSTDETRSYIKAQSRHYILHESDQNLGFGKANNLGLEYALKYNCDYVFLINQDVYLERNTIETLLQLDYESYGIISPLQCDGQGSKIDEDFLEFLGPGRCKDFLSDGILGNFKDKIYPCDGLVDYLEQNENIDVVQYPSVRNYGTKEGYVFKPAPEVISGTEAFYNKWIVENKISWIIWDKVYRRAVFEDLRFQQMHFEDNYLVAELLTKIKNLAIVDYGLYFYYKREGSITNSPHTFVKERDLQKVNLKIYNQLKCLKNVDAAKVKMQEIVLNCCLSLYRSYHQEFLVFSKNDINVWFLLWSGIKPKQKLKLLLFKIFGPQLFEDSFGTVSVDRMPTMLELEYFGERQ